MAEYINKYANDAAIQAAVDGGELIKPYVALDENTGLIDWNKKSIDYRSMPLTFDIIGDGNIIWKCGVTDFTKTLEYSKNGGEWTEITSTTGGTSLSVVSGDIIQFRGDNATYGGIAAKAWCNFTGTTCEFNIYGNIMSLIDSVNFSGSTTLSTANKYVFKSLFANCTGLTDVSNLLLPATTLVSSCYYAMFYGCTSLTTAPELPATTLVGNCYNTMFYGCSSLNYIKCLATDISASYCTQNWVGGVAASGTFVTPSTTNWPTSNSGIPSGWTRVNSD